MKTKILIEKLQKADPSGELECCVQNVDIVDVFEGYQNKPSNRETGKN